ncbi:MAG: type II toxin-antitoxin system HicB family antitoxin [Deltaproteobacteria bacterium]|nr:type II toxin-antitoxin system HicB family antitoxin [Deltaproteobacteria bacterium]MDL1961403.1 type II toxin-antitoxin system HicB family antitoxin [Deltaproteobacteria bacterium]
MSPSFPPRHQRSLDRSQGKTKEESLWSLSEAIELILQDRREDGLRGLPADAVQDVVVAFQDLTPEHWRTQVLLERGHGLGEVAGEPGQTTWQ